MTERERERETLRDKIEEQEAYNNEYTYVYPDVYIYEICRTRGGLLIATRTERHTLGGISVNFGIW